jgi:hypothetical protein
MIREMLPEECDRATQYDITRHRSTWNRTRTPDNEKPSGKYPSLWTSVLPEQYLPPLHEHNCTETFLVYWIRMKHYMFYKYLQSKQDLTGQHRGVRGVWCQEMALLSWKKTLCNGTWHCATWQNLRTFRNNVLFQFSRCNILLLACR